MAVIDRSADLSQPLDKLGPDETLKANSDHLRGNIALDLLDSIAACGDVCRGVMATADPADSEVDREVAELAKTLSDRVIPRTGAYHEIWYGRERVATSEEHEPLNGATYLPRKFKIGFVVPPSNDIDVYTQDLGFIAIVGAGGVEGFNVTI